LYRYAEAPVEKKILPQICEALEVGLYGLNAVDP
jgi:hypothetical protein